MSLQQIYKSSIYALQLFWRQVYEGQIKDSFRRSPQTGREGEMTDREALQLCFSALNWSIGAIKGLHGRNEYPIEVAKTIEEHLTAPKDTDAKV